MRIHSVALIGAAIAVASCSLHFEQRDEAAFRRASYNLAFFQRHNPAFRTSAGIHFAHAKQHDVLALTPLADARRQDMIFDSECVHWLLDPPRMEPKMMYYGPHVGQAAWRLYWAIDWTHIHHAQTYDILSDDDIAWKDKASVTRQAVEYYLSKADVARSPAPLELTMRRAAVMMKPYFELFRNHYPRSATFFYVAHWWHPAIYEAQMMAGNDEQEAAIGRIQSMIPGVLSERPRRMLLSREVMPRYSRLSPESANIFDNLHMLHGFAYAILSYDGWTIDEQRAELYRVLDAMTEKPGDRELANRFDIPHPEMSPFEYSPWMQGYEGSMSSMIEEMLRDMWPMMSPDGSADVPPEVMNVLRMKLAPGMQPGEAPGSLHDAIMKLVKNMKMDPEGMKAGATPKMASMMAEKWRQKALTTTPVAPIAMKDDPVLAWPERRPGPPPLPPPGPPPTAGIPASPPPMSAPDAASSRDGGVDARAAAPPPGDEPVDAGGKDGAP